MSTFRRECGDKWATVQLSKHGVKDFVYSGANGDRGFLPVVTRTLLQLAGMGGPPPQTVRPLSSPHWEDSLAVLSQNAITTSQVRAANTPFPPRVSICLGARCRAVVSMGQRRSIPGPSGVSDITSRKAHTARTFFQPSSVKNQGLTNDSEVSSHGNRRISAMCGWWCWAS